MEESAAGHSCVRSLEAALYRHRACILCFVSCAHVVAAATIVSGGWASFASSALFLAIRDSGRPILAYNAAISMAAFVSGLLLLLYEKFFEPSYALVEEERIGIVGASSVRMIGRLHVIVGLSLPSIAMLCSDDVGPERLSVIFAAGSSIANALFFNGVILLLASNTDAVFSLCWLVPGSVIYGVCAALAVYSDMHDLADVDPGGIVEQLRMGLTFPLYLLAAAIIWYSAVHVRSLFRPSDGPQELHILVVKRLLVGGFTLLIFASAVAVATVTATGAVGSGGNRGDDLAYMKGNFLINVSAIVFITLVPSELKKLLLLRQAGDALRLIRDNERLRASMVRVLQEMVPPRVVRSLTAGIPVKPQSHEFVTLFFCDVEGFTAFSATRTPTEVMALLSRLFAAIEAEADAYEGQIYKMETVGDSFLAVGGLDVPAETVEEREALVEATARFALAVRSAVASVAMDERSSVRLRIGVHCGSLVTGLLGRLTPRFCAVGDTVNTASRMETTGRVGAVHASEDFALILLQGQVRRAQSRGLGQGGLAQTRGAAPLHVKKRDNMVDVKGKGLMSTYWIDDRPPDGSPPLASLISLSVLEKDVADVCPFAVDAASIELGLDGKGEPHSASSSDYAILPEPRPASSAMPLLRVPSYISLFQQ